MPTETPAAGGDRAIADPITGRPLTVSVTVGPDHPEWERFVESLPGVHHAQGTGWARVKSASGWLSARVALHEEGRIVAGAQVLAKRVSRLGLAGYVPQGPVCEPGRPELAAAVMTELHALGRARHWRFLAVQPPFQCESLSLRLAGLGFRPSWLRLTPTATVQVDLDRPEEAILADINQKTRQSIRKSEKEGLTFREARPGETGLFYQMHNFTARRQKFAPYPESYFTDLLATLGTEAAIVFVESEGEVVSGLLMVTFGTTAWSKLSGWTGRFPEKRPNQAVFWGAIRWARARGMKMFDFEGIDPDGAARLLRGESLPEHLKKSPDFLKVGFGGRIVLRPAAHDYVYPRLGRWIYRRASSWASKRSDSFMLLERIRRRI